MNVLLLEAVPRDHSLRIDIPARHGNLGNSGRSYSDVLPYFKKSEHYEGLGDQSRGRSGLLNVSDIEQRHTLCGAPLDAAQAVGFPLNKDYNSGEQEGFWYFQVMIKNGRRWSAARALLDLARSRPNVRILTDALVNRIMLDGKRGWGRLSINGEKLEERCAREVVVSCVAGQALGMLELSDIGKPELLKQFGVEVRHELKDSARTTLNFAPLMSWHINRPNYAKRKHARILGPARATTGYTPTGDRCRCWRAIDAHPVGEYDGRPRRCLSAELNL
ncbi:GMC family oxidoreductase N-terminal domain-containing protein [Bradyrhizobium arachidis]|uniref:GMC family oxidoreductase N-terminal domain-containing protein n=1 Tax=Bradyrhizobium arachidis TaxID=858423 RepID=UPI002162EB18|nr:GMC family oxidoreductase N-terminal domain-containing protein [Bradyrhizobium arachidis]UVO35712.1 GMC family oxidoreductase N-terminal domain-containing protein [Bradyrhizobium arachidis]